MSDPVDTYPDWVIKQRGWRYRVRVGEGRFMNRKKLVQDYSEHLVKEGMPVTFDAIREMLLFVDRGYSLRHQQICFALAGMYKRKVSPLPKMPNGRPVHIEGHEYPSARSAAEALGISPQTVLNRIASARPEWAGWTR